ncbi:MAG: EcsC family protein [Deltaproteobacteria bacterium]|nr:EcsC family protein [Deltaproteobacteria bacterium]
MEGQDLEDLREAKRLLESFGIAIRLANLAGKPMEKAVGMLPGEAAAILQKTVRTALEAALNVAVKTLGKDGSKVPALSGHKLFAGLSGAAGGAMGMAGLGFDLPFTTILMLRSIAEIARFHGEDLKNIETRLECLSVFALGGVSEQDDSSKTGYFAVRAMLARHVLSAMEYITSKGTADRTAPALARLISLIAERFGEVVSEKAALAMVPVAGALGGAVVNSLFMDHFQKVATGHFIIRRLERKYGEEKVRKAFDMA